MITYYETNILLQVLLSFILLGIVLLTLMSLVNTHFFNKLINLIDLFFVICLNSPSKAWSLVRSRSRRYSRRSHDRIKTPSIYANGKETQYAQLHADYKLSYECGFDSFSDARNAFDVQFYFVALLFLIFDLEIIYLYPAAYALTKVSLFSYTTVILFLTILTLGYIYEWFLGALDWSPYHLYSAGLDRAGPCDISHGANRACQAQKQTVLISNKQQQANWFPAWLATAAQVGGNHELKMQNLAPQNIEMSTNVTTQIEGTSIQQPASLVGKIVENSELMETYYVEGWKALGPQTKKFVIETLTQPQQIEEDLLSFFQSSDLGVASQVIGFDVIDFKIPMIVVFSLIIFFIFMEAKLGLELQDLSPGSKIRSRQALKANLDEHGSSRARDRVGSPTDFEGRRLCRRTLDLTHLRRSLVAFVPFLWLFWCFVSLWNITNLLSLIVILEVIQFCLLFLALKHKGETYVEAVAKLIIYTAIITSTVIMSFYFFITSCGGTDWWTIQTSLLNEQGFTWIINPLFLLLLLLCFKLASWPFFFWTADFYVGVDFKLIAVLSTLSKLATLVLMLRIMLTLVPFPF